MCRARRAPWCCSGAASIGPDGVHFVTVGNTGQNSHRISPLRPGVTYWFNLAVLEDDDGDVLVSNWSGWVRHDLAGAERPCDGWQSAVPVENTRSYDQDGNGLIDVSTLDQLDAMRHDLDGDCDLSGPGTEYAYCLAFPDAAPGMGCPLTGCTGVT